MRLDGHVAVITGASSGIGAAAARVFAREGARVHMGARTVAAVEKLAEEIRAAGGRAEAHALDVTDEASVRAFAAAVRARAGAVDLLLNNAGVGIGGKLLETSVEDFDVTMATNLRGPFLVLKEFLPLMLNGPRLRTVVNVASVSGTVPVGRLSVYAASKWGLRGLSLSVALEVAKRGVRVVSLNPGYVATPMVDDAPYTFDQMIQPEELAETIIRIATLPDSVHVDDVTVHPMHLYTE